MHADTLLIRQQEGVAIQTGEIEGGRQGLLHPSLAQQLAGVDFTPRLGDVEPKLVGSRAS